MAIYRTYQCPECERNFDFLHHPNDEPPPSFCPLCGADVSGKKKTRMKSRTRFDSPAKSLPIPKGAAKNVDGIYRGMEAATDQRMLDAAEVLGVDPKSLSGMKMTNMKDNLREGDLSQSTTVSSATQITGNAPIAAAANGGAVSGLGFNPNASEYAKTTGTGAVPYAGNTAREMVNSLHSAKGHNVVAAGRLNKK
jgi:hypothetical protein